MIEAPPTLKTTNWDRFGTAAAKSRASNDRSISVFQRRPRVASDGNHLVYDEPFVPTVAILVTLHCLTCKNFKCSEVVIPEGVRQPPAIISYQCANCSPKYRHRDSISIVKANPNAYYSWVAMKDRCFNKNRHFFCHYGGRGITVCPRWIAPGSGFKNFLEDLGERRKDQSIDRIDVNGNYTPTNCRWATQAEQNANQRKPYWWKGTDAEWEVEKAKRIEEIRRYEAMEDDNTFSGDF